MRRTNNWLVCDLDERHQFGPGPDVPELERKARERGWTVGRHGDRCGLEHEDVRGQE